MCLGTHFLFLFIHVEQGDSPSHASLVAIHPKHFFSFATPGLRNRAASSSIQGMFRSSHVRQDSIKEGVP